MKKIPWFILILIILILGGGLAYAKSAGFLDIFLSKDNNEAKQVAREAVFPDTIGDYILNTSRINVEEPCRDLSTSSDTKNIASGKVCLSETNAQYRNPNDKKTVFVQLQRVTEGADLYKLVIKSLGRSEIISDYNIVRFDNHKFAWFPREDFGTLFITEGMYTIDENGNESIDYKLDANGQNAVAQYFFKKYPPVDELNPTKE